MMRPRAGTIVWTTDANTTKAMAVSFSAVTPWDRRSQPKKAANTGSRAMRMENTLGGKALESDELE